MILIHGPSPFLHNMKVSIPLWISTLEPMSTSTHAAPHSHPAIHVKTNVLLSHLAWIRQLKRALLNGRTDSWCCVSSWWDWYHLPRRQEHPLLGTPTLTSHNWGYCSLCPEPRLHPVPSLCIATILPDLEILLAVFFPLLAHSLGDLSTGTGVSGSVLPAAYAGWAPPADFTEAFLGVKMCSATEHLLSGTLQSTGENNAHMHF